MRVGGTLELRWLDDVLAVLGLTFLQKLVHLYRLKADHGLKSRGGPADHLTGSLLTN